MKELIIDVVDDVKNIYLLEDDVLVEKYIESSNKKRLEGNIYIGKVQNVIPGLQAAFVNVGEHRNAFIHLKDVLPKRDITKEEEYSLEEYDIEKVLKPGMPIIVEIKRDSYNKKGARASTHINLPGRYLVLLPNSSIITVSQKIEDNDERNRLIEICKNIIPDNYGMIVRTSAIGKNENELRDDLENLIKKWNEIIKIEFDRNDIPKLINKSEGIIDKLLIDLIDKDLRKISVSNNEMANLIKNRLEFFNKADIEVMTDTQTELIRCNIEKQLSVSKGRKVWLKSGGFITIDKTEALTAIDVNSAKYTGENNLEETAFMINKESAIEIAKQIRLRDIGGIIVIDFIDLHNEIHKKELVNIFAKELKKERTKVQIEGFTKLNLLELTRKHIYSE